MEKGCTSTVRWCRWGDWKVVLPETTWNLRCTHDCRDETVRPTLRQSLVLVLSHTCTESVWLVLSQYLVLVLLVSMAEESELRQRRNILLCQRISSSSRSKLSKLGKGQGSCNSTPSCFLLRPGSGKMTCSDQKDLVILHEVYESQTFQ